MCLNDCKSMCTSLNVNLNAILLYLCVNFSYKISHNKSRCTDQKKIVTEIILFFSMFSDLMCRKKTAYRLFDV